MYTAASAFLTTNVWALEGSVLSRLCEVLSLHVSGERVEATIVAEAARAGRERADRNHADRIAARRGGGGGGDEQEDGPGYVMVGNVAVVPVEGVLAKYSSMINGMSQPQGMTHGQVAQAIARAAADRQTRAVLLDIDSPGGTVAGMDDLTGAVERVRAGSNGGAGIPVVAYAHDLAASAAFWLAASADSIYANALSNVGSIGVYTVLVDSSMQAEKAGLRTYLVASGANKGVGEDGVPITASQLAVVQERINDIHERFVSHVAAGRGVAAEQIAALADGRTFTAHKAQAAGLIDGVASLADVIAGMNAEFNKPAKK
jgi:signal peptide peptidase SppA